MNVTAEKMPDSQVLLTIEIDAERVEKSMDQAYRRVLPRVRVPGFRPGKAPRRVLERHVGREALLQEALDRLVPEVVNEAIKDQDLQMIDQPELEVSSLDPVIVKATVPIRPTIDLGSYRDLRLEAEPVEVDEAEVEKAVEELRQRYATTEPVERPIQEGDRVRVSILGEVENRRVLANDDAELTVRPDTLTGFPGLLDQLLGMAKDEAAEFDATVPEDDRRSEIAGKPIHYSLTVLEVNEEHLPELDAEFAKQVGEGFESLDALRERLRSDIRTRAEDEAKRTLQEKAVEELMSGIATLEYPPQLVEREVDHMLREITQSAGGADRRALDRVLQQVGRSDTELRDEFRVSATDRVRRTLVLSRLAELEGLDVTPDDVEQELNNLSGATPQAAQIRQIFDTPNGREMIERQLRSRRTLDRLTEIVTGQAPPLPETAIEALAEGETPPATEAPSEIPSPSDADAALGDPDAPAVRETVDAGESGSSLLSEASVATENEGESGVRE